MRTDAFTRRAPLVIFIYFAGAIVIGALMTHPAHLASGAICGAAYYMTLTGRRGVKTLLVFFALSLVIAVINPFFNTAGDTVLFSAFGRPYTLEALIRGALAAGAFFSAVIWFACFNAVMSGDKFTALFGNIAPSLSTVLVMIFRLVPEMKRRTGLIGEARTAIGKGAGGTLREKFSAGVASLGALTTYSLEGGVTAGDSMRARGYGVSRRTSFAGKKAGCADVLFAVVTLSLAAAALFFVFRGAAGVVFDPRFSAAPLNGENLVCFIACTAYYIIPLVLRIREDTIWTISKYRI